MSAAERRRELAREVLGRHISVGAAAGELQITVDALGALFRRNGEHPSAYLATVPVPEGMRIKAITQGTRGSTVHLDRESSDPPTYATVPEGHRIKGMSTLVDGQGQVRGQWVKTDLEKAQRDELFWESLKVHAKEYKGLAGTSVPPAKGNLANLCTFYPWGDPHIGMLAWARESGKDFDLRIAERDLLAATEMLVAGAPASKRAVLVNLGDFFHAQNTEAVTPKGKNQLDVDGRLRKVTEIGFSILRRAVDLLLRKHDQVELVNVRGNHDPELAHMLAIVFQAIYEREPRVIVHDNASPYTYITHGKCLVGIGHGDGAKIERLPGIMAADQPEAWGRSIYRYWYQGHLHQKIVREFPGCLVEVFRTLATADAWAYWMGFRSGSSLEAITLDAEYGEIMRAMVDLRLVRKAT